MDSIRASEAPDTGSIPVEATASAEALAKAGKTGIFENDFKIPVLIFR
jgi:hypothetical protein